MTTMSPEQMEQAEADLRFFKKRCGMDYFKSILRTWHNLLAEKLGIERKTKEYRHIGYRAVYARTFARHIDGLHENYMLDKNGMHQDCERGFKFVYKEAANVHGKFESMNVTLQVMRELGHEEDQLENLMIAWIKIGDSFLRECKRIQEERYVA